MSAAASLDLPMPASPDSSTTRPSPVIRLQRPGDPFEVLGPKISQFEETADEPAGGRPRQ
jgi:hypothetical protein